MAAGYAYCYERTFSWPCLWQRRPHDWRAVPAYLLMSVLYKKMNAVWPWLIRQRLTHTVWWPLLELSRRRHARFRRRLASADEAARQPVAPPVYAGV